MKKVAQCETTKDGAADKKKHFACLVSSALPRSIAPISCHSVLPIAAPSLRPSAGFTALVPEAQSSEAMLNSAVALLRRNAAQRCISLISLTATPRAAVALRQPRRWMHVCTCRSAAAAATAVPRASVTTAAATAPASSAAASLSPSLTGESSPPPLPFAIVGSGPAAFYTAKYLLREVAHLHIDMFERLPVPFGLVRFGVAPDHPDVKSVAHDFESVMNDTTRFRFWGNVQVGKDVSIDELRQHYAGVVLAYGAAGERMLNIPGSHLAGIHPARHFVNWYNAHPEHTEKQHDFHLDRVQTAVIVGFAHTRNTTHCY